MLPIVAIVIVLCLFVMPMQADLLLCFLIGGLLIVAGMGLFSLGAEQAMMPIGSKIGTALTKTKNLPLILGVSFLLGFAITVAEPDLQVLAQTVPHIKSSVLLITVGKSAIIENIPMQAAYILLFLLNFTNIFEKKTAAKEAVAA